MGFLRFETEDYRNDSLCYCELYGQVRDWFVEGKIALTV